MDFAVDNWPLTAFRWLVFLAVSGWLFSGLPEAVWLVGALLFLAITSWWAMGNQIGFALVTIMLAIPKVDLHGDEMLEGAYLPAYVLLAALYLVIRLVVIFPELGRSTQGPGTGGGFGGDGGGGGGGC
ncbi:putative membrane protein YgcG [Natronospira proteinivora]|uniref:Membrane protein YgcG n=1 Tax=Natronospira proteinivora TaxID=1807133 RepID=A0ABT1G924_9GAMM|nr:hypothetical protein [Natronospira proteinivora]MCP1727405.1 putative membrane protein YgcG [Natronospira proteinivora]